MRTKANNTLLEENEKLTEKRAVIYSLDRETRKEILAFYHWELMTPRMIQKTAELIQRGL
jgi:hypothetical protein